MKIAFRHSSKIGFETATVRFYHLKEGSLRLSIAVFHHLASRTSLIILARSAFDNGLKASTLIPGWLS